MLNITPEQLDALVGHAINCGFAAGLASGKEHHACEEVSGLREQEAAHQEALERLITQVKAQVAK